MSTDAPLSQKTMIWVTHLGEPKYWAWLQLWSLHSVSRSQVECGSSLVS